MTDEIRPALTPEEWNPVDPSGEWEATGPRCGDEAWIEGGAVWLPAFNEGDEIVQNQHGLAALCLSDQPFGFTQEDVDLLLVFAIQEERAANWCPDGYVFGTIDETHRASRCEDAKRLRALASRIAALLPPHPDRAGEE